MASKPPLTIKVCGPPESGRSQIANLIANAIKEQLPNVRVVVQDDVKETGAVQYQLDRTYNIEVCDENGNHATE